MKPVRSAFLTGIGFISLAVLSGKSPGAEPLRVIEVDAASLPPPSVDLLIIRPAVR